MKYYLPRHRKWAKLISGGRTVFSSELFRLGLETGVGTQQPERARAGVLDERSLGCKLKEAFTFRATLVQVFLKSAL